MRMRPRQLVLLAAPGGAALALALSSGHAGAAGLPSTGTSHGVVPQVAVTPPGKTTTAGGASAQTAVTSSHSGPSASASASVNASPPGQAGTTASASVSAGASSAGNAPVTSPAVSAAVTSPAGNASVSTGPSSKLSVSAGPAAASVSTTPSGTPSVAAHAGPAPSQPAVQPGRAVQQTSAPVLPVAAGTRTTTPQAGRVIAAAPAGRPGESAPAPSIAPRAHPVLTPLHPAVAAHVHTGAHVSHIAVRQARTHATHSAARMTLPRHTRASRAHHARSARPQERLTVPHQAPVSPVLRHEVRMSPVTVSGHASAHRSPAAAPRATVRFAGLATDFSLFDGFTNGAGAGSPAPITGGGPGAAGMIALLLPLLGLFAWRRIWPSSLRRPDEVVLGHLVPPG